MAVETLDRLTLLDPRVDARPRIVARAVRLSELRDKRVGLLANGKPNAEEFLSVLGALLRERHGVASLVTARKPNASRVVPEETLGRLAAECDVVVTGVGD